MIKRLTALLLALLLFTAGLAGCKIETPEQAAANASAQAQPSATLSPSPESSQPPETYSIDEAPEPDSEEYQKYLDEANTRTLQEQRKDQYQTDPVPSGMPQPVEEQDAVVDKSKQYTCTILIECTKILDNIDQLDPAKLSVLPAGGILLGSRQVVFYQGESVFDVLLRETKKNRIHMEFQKTPAFNSSYIQGIGNLYERDCGELSGWMYSVNGWYPNYGCSRYQLKQGDVIAWRYTCDLGRDLGVNWIQQ